MSHSAFTPVDTRGLIAAAERAGQRVLVRLVAPPHSEFWADRETAEFLAREGAVVVLEGPAAAAAATAQPGAAGAS